MERVELGQNVIPEHLLDVATKKLKVPSVTEISGDQIASHSSRLTKLCADQQSVSYSVQTDIPHLL